MEETFVAKRRTESIALVTFISDKECCIDMQCINVMNICRKKRKGRRGGVEKEDGEQEFVKRKSPRRKILHNDDDDK